jgi:hypothetical protein
MKSHFNGNEQLLGKPKILRRSTLFKMVQKVKVVLGKGPKPKKDPKPTRTLNRSKLLFCRRIGVLLIGGEGKKTAKVVHNDVKKNTKKGGNG